MTSEDHSLNLALLPPDLIRIIIGHDGASLQSASLISRSWHSLVSEYNASCPSLECCTLVSRFNELDIYLIVTASRSKYLKKYIRAHPDIVWRPCNNMPQEYGVVITAPIDGGAQKQKDEENLIAFLTKTLSRFKRIICFQICLKTMDFFEVIDKALNADIVLGVGYLCFFSTTFNISLRWFTLKFLNERTFEQIHLYAHGIVSTDTREILMKIPKMTSQFHMAQFMTSSMASDECFGQSANYWDNIAQEMTENGMKHFGVTKEDLKSVLHDY